MAEINTMGVIGGGQMGSGIAQVGVVGGLDVWLCDTDPDALIRASKSISNSIQRFISKGQLSQVNKGFDLNVQDLSERAYELVKLRGNRFS